MDELQKLANNAFGAAARAIIDQFISAKMPPHLKKSINQAHLENDTYEQIVTQVEKELQLNSLEYPDETQMNSVTHKQKIEGNPDNAGIINSDTNDSNPNNHKIDRKSRTLYPPCETCGKTNHSTERCYVGANAENRPLPWKNKPQELVVSKLQPNILTMNVKVSLRNSDWQTGDQQKNIPPIPCVVWQQPLEIFVDSSS